MKTYNGHRSWNCWNVSLWMENDESIYNFAMDCLKNTNNDLNKAVRAFMACYGGEKTPDGGVYNHLAVREALKGFIE